MKPFLFWTGLALLMSGPVQAQETPAWFTSACGTCHQLEGPASASVDVRRNRVGPPLFYAGNKFRKEWLVGWLQDPVRLRPAGDYAMTAARGTPEGDTVDEAALPEHPKLDTTKAEEAGAYLMTLKPYDSLIAAEDYTPGTVPMRMGTMDFVKFKGCGACHKDTPKYGGFSGPELYTAWQRLQPEFITSYIRDPKAWEPRSLMPNKHLATGAVHKLANYLRAIGEDKGAAK